MVNGFVTLQSLSVLGEAAGGFANDLQIYDQTRGVTNIFLNLFRFVSFGLSLAKCFGLFNLIRP